MYSLNLLSMDLKSNEIVHGWTKLVDPFFYKKISRGKMIKQPSSFYHSYTQLVSNFRRGEISEGIWETVVPHRGYFLMLFASCILQIGFNASWLHWTDHWKSFCQRFLTIWSVPGGRMPLRFFSWHLMSLVSLHRSRLGSSIVSSIIQKSLKKHSWCTITIVTSANRKENVSWKFSSLKNFFLQRQRILLTIDYYLFLSPWFIQKWKKSHYTREEQKSNKISISLNSM